MITSKIRENKRIQEEAYGLFSRSKGYATNPGVFTDLVYLKSWIESIIKANISNNHRNLIPNQNYKTDVVKIILSKRKNLNNAEYYESDNRQYEKGKSFGKNVFKWLQDINLLNTAFAQRMLKGSIKDSNCISKDYKCDNVNDAIEAEGNGNDIVIKDNFITKKHKTSEKHKKSGTKFSDLGRSAVGNEGFSTRLFGGSTVINKEEKRNNIEKHQRSINKRDVKKPTEGIVIEVVEDGVKEEGMGLSGTSGTASTEEEEIRREQAEALAEIVAHEYVAIANSESIDKYYKMREVSQSEVAVEPFINSGNDFLDDIEEHPLEEVQVILKDLEDDFNQEYSPPQVEQDPLDYPMYFKRNPIQDM